MMMLTSSHLIVKKLSKDIWSVCTEQKCDGSLIMTPFCLLTEEMIRNAPYFQLEVDNPYELKRSNTEEVLKMWRAYKRVCDEN